MFTGLVETIGSVRRVKPEGDGRRLEVEAPAFVADTAIGDSVAIDGVCLTIVAIDGPVLAFQSGPETLSRTTHGRLKAGSRVNLERALAVGRRLGGHFVQGHVDGMANVHQRQAGREWETFWFAADRALLGQMIPKGSVAIDGISLTIVDVTESRFSVALIPHTLDHSTLGDKRAGDPVNVESDVLGKYVRRFLEHGRNGGGVDMALLQRAGFV
jgi:riboflavin synthase